MLQRGWLKRAICIGLVSVLILSAGGCASYNTRHVQMDPGKPYSKGENGDLCLYVDEYATETKCKQAFDSDLAGDGVLALLVKIENNGEDPYEISAKDFVISGGPITLRPMSAADAAAKAKRNPVGRALGWSMIVPIISIPVAVAASAIHTHQVNEQIEEDFVAKALKDGSILPQKERSGFLFFELTGGRKDLSELQLSMTAKNGSTLEMVSLLMPLPGASFKSPNVQTNTSENKTDEH